MSKKKGPLPIGNMSRQKSKLLMRSGVELDDMMFDSVTQNMRKGNNAKRLARNAETGIETKQSYNLGGGTHNTYSGKKK